MILDLSKLSPTCRDEILTIAQNKCSNNAWVILNDLPRYSEGEVKQEMENWRKAAQEIVREIHAFKYPITTKIRNKTA
jgi:hypothetical protein